MAKKTLTAVEKNALDLLFFRLLGLTNVREEPVYGTGFVFSDQIDWDSSAGAVQLGGQIGGTTVSPDIRGIRETLGPTLLTIGNIPDGTVLTRVGASVIGTSNGGAPLDARYVTLALNGDLTSERVLTGTVNQILLTDGGPGGNVTLSLDNTVVRVGGQIGGTGASPTIVGIKETSGPTLLSITGIPDGQFLRRSGATVIGSEAVEIGGQLGGTAASPTVIGITETSGPDALTFGGIADGQALKRSGLTVVGFDSVELAGQLGGSTASPDVRGLRETSGPNLLTYGAIADGAYLKRNGLTVVGGTPVELGGQLGGSISAPDVRGIRETSGPDLLAFGAIADGQYLKRSGLTVVSGTPVELGGQIGGTTVSPDIRGLRESGGTLLTYGAIGDGKAIKRSGLTAVGFTAVEFAGQIGGSATSPDIRGIRETSGPTLLTFGGIADGGYLRRAGATVVYGNPAEVAGQIGGTAASPEIIGIKESGGQLLSIGSIVDGQALRRSGGDIIGFDAVSLAGQLGGSTFSPDVRGIREVGGPTLLTFGTINDGEYLVRSGATIVGSTTTGGAPANSTFVTLSTDATLSNERVLTGTANQITITDNGAGGTVVLSLPQSINTGATVTFAQQNVTSKFVIQNSGFALDLFSPVLIADVDITFPNITGTLESQAYKGVANGYASLDGTGKVPVAQLSLGSPVTIGTANADGVATTLARSDHVHSHGAQTSGTLHAAVIAGGASGFMTGADKTKLDGIATGATATPLTASAPVNINKAAAAVGVSTEAARADHKHDITTGVAGSITIGAAGAEGSSANLARADHTHGFTAPVAPQTIGTANSAGTGTAAAREDHVHSHGAQTDGSLHAAVIAAGASGFMTGADKTKLDGIASGATNTPLSAAAPQSLGVAAAGIGTSASRDDHVHAHGNLAGGSLHSIAVAGVSDGFLSSTDKTKLDGIASGAEVNTAANVGLGTGTVYRDKSGATLNFKSIKAGTNVTITNNADDIEISAAGSSSAPVGASYVVLGVDGTLTSERVLTGTAGQISVTDGGAGTTVTLALDSTVVRVGGQIGGTGTSPTILGIRETGGPTLLTFGAIADGKGLARSGTDVIGVDLLALTAVAPSDVTKAAASVGVATAAARADHKHDISTAAPSSIGTANAEGTATSLARSDHVHNHGAQTDGSLHAAVIAAGASGFMTGADKTKLDGIAAGATATPLTAVAPVNVTKAAAVVGVSTDAARADHKHDITTAVAGAITIGAAAAEGTATSLARSDHAHSLAAPAAPQTVGTANATGSGTAAAREDHVHNHGAQTDSTHHAVATTIAAGFMSAADKTKLDAVTRAILQWGNNGISTTTTTRYMTPGWGDATAGTTEIKMVMPCSGTLKNFYVKQNTAGVSANTTVYTVRKNGVDTTLTVSLAATSTAATGDTTHSVSVAAGDEISISMTRAAAITTSPVNVSASLEVQQ